MSSLFSEFKPVTAEEWKAQITKDLKGEAFENLIWKNENGFDIKPFYTSADLQQTYQPTFTHADWDICVNGKSQDATILNAQLLKQLNSGASAIAIHCSGLDLNVALRGIGLNFIRFTFYVDKESGTTLHKYLLENYTDPASLYGSLFPAKLNSDADLTEWLNVMNDFKNFVNIKTAAIDNLSFHNLNCLAYYEVALILSGLNEYLNKASSLRPREPFVIKTGVNTDYFIQIAKLRAIRRLWSVLSADYNVSSELHVIVESSMTNKSISDSYNNLLRTTLEAMAAVSGGCNELIITEFDALLSVNKNLAERMAINQQLILKEETYLDKMADIACGSYYIESMTDIIATKALDTLKRFEQEGGYFKCLEKNIFSSEIAAQADKKSELINNKSQIVIGVNKFRNEKENISLITSQIELSKQSSLNNPVLNFELTNIFK